MFEDSSVSESNVLGLSVLGVGGGKAWVGEDEKTRKHEERKEYDLGSPLKN